MGDRCQVLHRTKKTARTGESADRRDRCAEQAIDHLRSDTYDAILCDIHIPGMSGLELAHQFHEDTPRTALILMTGDRDDRVEELARRAGAVGYLRKPFSSVELDETLARVMVQG